MSTALADLIKARIEADGPISLADYMADCLMHPVHGYYATRDPFGATGDFITAPEISQMFGEMIGLCLAQAWLDQGAPARIILAEAGPGRGTLMADILRAARAVPEFGKAAEVHLIETSAALRPVQSETLTQAGYRAEQVTWHAQIQELPENAPLYFVANEFFDALPIRQFERDPNGWSERRVGLHGNTLTLGRTVPAAQEALAPRMADTSAGDIVEICPAAAPIAARIGAQIETHGGVALIVDYGDWRSLGDTFQAVEDHAPTDPFAAPGTADLTAHVDFETLASSTPSAHSLLTPQGVFLERLGITARAQALAAKLGGAALEAHIAAHRRLTHPEEMGTLFKVIAFAPHGAPMPAGLEPAPAPDGLTENGPAA